MKQLSSLPSFLLLCLAACQSNPSTPAATAATPPAAAKPTPPRPAPATPEHIEASMVTVSGLPDEEVTTQQLIRQLGRPDRIAKGAVECGSRLSSPIDRPDGDLWYYGKTVYEVSGTQAILSSFDVTSGKFRGKIGKLVLDKNTTLEDVRRFFPAAAKEADEPAGHGRPGEVMSLPFYDKGVPMDGALELQFQHGHLQAVEFFSPC
ncbi:hypothetical protein [Hymenobacter ruricola]|uniref:Outer membrane protein assembly factor BamE n=1 Tax=Hymenobacter ruricola TaxID=2791023 RepID=A0ABS0I655_9BACT|nr:hypothetical protein [Hymenobacter ruricola]MBF9222410.1 hypothetical protein [Hymenobacter ruricola]